ncbi:MAG: Na+/H+ antiporter subunit B [Fimbriimonadaceae bacterium]
MNSLILRTGTTFVMPLLLVFSLFLLIRGHNLPGGGFAGGLVAAASLALYGLSNGMNASKAVLRVRPETLIAAGLLTAVVSGALGLAVRGSYLAPIWWSIGSVKVGTPILFDVGVYLLVVGVVLTMVFALSAEEPS